jgi:hypothetical protein
MSEKKAGKSPGSGLPRGSMPPPGKVHRDQKKEADRQACRKFRHRKSGLDDSGDESCGENRDNSGD